ncbi:MAG: ATP-binding protein [Muribaculaceae bacterium]|nr:ATP-binding protein [Muribaculaceae bacterium]
METPVKYPLGIETFEKLRTEGYLYVDKTRFISQLISSGQYYFLSRPRRFGKSLFLSTLEAYFTGQRELFEGLDIAVVEKEWKKYPVLRLSLNGKKYVEAEHLVEHLNSYLEIWEATYCCSKRDRSPEERFANVLRAAFEQTGERVVVLVDEYDLPLEDTLENPDLQEAFRKQLKAFYGTMKPCDRYVRFAFLTGVTKFGHVGVFSDLNNIRDITLNPVYNSICGATDEELEHYLLPHIQPLAQANGLTAEECTAQLRKDYDGYRFSSREEKVYNLFSVMSAMIEERFGRYWFRTGTPTLLVKMLQSKDYRISNLDGEVRNERELLDVDTWRSDPIPMFFQSGYLTVKDYDARFGFYTLGIPNEEVREGLYDWLLPVYAGPAVPPSAFNMGRFVRAVENGEADVFMELLKSLFASVPYEQVPKVGEKRAPDYEVHYQNLCLMLFHLMGLYVKTEMRTSSGRIDVLVETPRYVYIIELKVRGTAKKALRQIEDKGYTIPYEAGDREVIRIGAVFSPRTRTLRDWKVVR